MHPSDRANIVIVGGAIVGSSVATFLALRPDWRGRIVVVERDLTYRTSSTTLSAASIRLQFSTPLNIEISRFGIGLIKDLDRWLGVDGAPPPEIDFVEGGYLFLATEAGLPVLRHNHAVQREHDVQVALLDAAELQARFPWMRTDDLAGGSLGLADEGWFDAYALLQVFRRKARSLGVEYVAGEVAAIERDGSAISGVRLADGRQIATELVVNAAGPRAAERGRHGRGRAAGAAAQALRVPLRLPRAAGTAPLTIAPSGRLLSAGGRGLDRRLLAARGRGSTRTRWTWRWIAPASTTSSGRSWPGGCRPSNRSACSMPGPGTTRSTRSTTTPSSPRIKSI